VTDIFSGAGSLPMAGIVPVALLVLLCTLVRHLPQIIWSLRCPRDDRHYRCPPPPSGRSAVLGLFRARHG
jgi:hypothetical protein